MDDIVVPEDYRNRTMQVIFGREVFIVRQRDGSIYIKKVRCNKCGKCCQDPGPAFSTYMVDGVEYCVHCEREGDVWVCRDGKVPFGCLSETGKNIPHKDCVIEYEKRKSDSITIRFK